MKRYLLVVSMLFVALQLLGQPPGDPGGGADPDVPITGIEILVGVGGALGIKRILSKKKKIT